MNFYPRPPRGGRQNQCCGLPGLQLFLSTPSARRATQQRTGRCPGVGISIHALREEGDNLHDAAKGQFNWIFLSTPSARRATPALYDPANCGIFLSTPSARRATYVPRPRCPTFSHFYPRPPRGGRPIDDRWLAAQLRFLSTPSARRATTAFPKWVRIFCNFYPRPPRGGRRSCASQRVCQHGFLSTPSARRATRNAIADVLLCFLISIHALREEGDIQDYTEAPQTLAISIHALREEGDLPFPKFDVFASNISIHALREEGDFIFLSSSVLKSLFLSTPSARRATPCFLRTRQCACISIHALREEGDSYTVLQW